MKCAETRVRRGGRGGEAEKINEMQFEPRAAFAPAIDRTPAAERSRKGERGTRERERERTETFHATNHDITAARERRAVLSHKRPGTKESILSSLSRNDPIQPLDFTLRSRYETISISFAKGPSGTEDFLDISRRFGHSPRTTLSRLSPSAPHLLLFFSFPFSRLARRISRSNRVARNWRACCPITRTFA